jgi:small subunit ribosomal protein S17
MKVLQKIITSAKTAHTVTVMVERRWQHPLYKKFVKINKSYACHVADDKLKLVEGDMVSIQECKPISKTKHFVVTEKVDKMEKVTQ